MTTPITMMNLPAEHALYADELTEAIQTVLHSGRYIQGEEVARFEEALAKWWGAPFVVSCANGTDALLLALLSLDLPTGSAVAIPSFNYVSAAEVSCLLGLRPLWMEVDQDTYLSGVEHLEKVFVPECKAVIVPHLFGQSADMKGFMDFAAQKGIWVIEDNAQSMGSTFLSGPYSGKKAGTVGHIGTTSFFPTKPIGCMGDGGAVCANDQAIARKLRQLASHGQSSKYHYASIGMNSRLDTLQAAILNVKLPYVDQNAANRKRVVQSYSRLLRPIQGLHVPVCNSYSTHVFHQYTIRLASHVRKHVQEHLRKVGIESVVYYPLPLHKQMAYQGLNFFHSEPLDHCEILASEVLSLPIHPCLSDEDISRVVSALADAIGTE